MGKVIFISGIIIFMAVLTVVLYCGLVMASREDEYLEERMRREKETGEDAE